MITLEDARKIFAEMVIKSERKYQIDDIWEVYYDEPIYVMTVIDENGNQLFPGEVFPSIRKTDGSLCNFSFPTPT